LYRAPEFLAERLTTLRQLTRPAASIQAQAIRLQPAVQQALRARGHEVSAAAMMSQIGSGALPVDQLPSYGLAIRPASRLEARLRGLPRPIIGRTADKTLWLDLRCLEPAEEPEFLAQWSALPR
jgi:L-seryl-tRNA(Ser) seleniumtransferase